MSNDPAPIDESLSVRLVKALLLTGVRFAAHFVAAAAYCIVSVKLVFPLTAMFDDFEVELPAGTQGVIIFSDLMAKFWYLLFVALLLIDAPLMFALQMMRPSRQWVVRLWFSGILVTVLLSIGWIVLWITVPLEGIWEALR